MPRTLTDWLDWMGSQHPVEMDLTLDRIRSVAGKLGLITWDIPVVTVAGTNGKGSCVALLQSILTAAGYRVGSYTSPHLFCFNERICLDGIPLGDVALIAACDVIAKTSESLGCTLSFFEYATLMALYCFKQMALDVLVLEVGLGGRLDAVNIVDPDVAIITSIALDHMAYLGENREAIAFEKAGIMRANKPVIFGELAVPEAICAQASLKQAPLYCLGRDFFYSACSTDDHWSYQGDYIQYNALPLPCLAVQNAATVLTALTCLVDKLPISPEAVAAGLQAVRLPARCQSVRVAGINHHIDVAHNPAASTHFARYLAIQPDTGRTWAVVGMLADKDLPNTLLPIKNGIHPFKNNIDHWCLGGLDKVTSRGATAGHLEQAARQIGISQLSCFETVVQAYNFVTIDGSFW